MRCLPATSAALLLLASTALVGPLLNVPAQSIEFARDIRPLLSDACFKCHGPDATTREADLRLDTEAGLLSELSGQPVVKRGNSSQSELIRRIFSDDPDEQMPPKSSNKSLTNEQKELLVRWIDEGAQWQQHWSFVRPVDVAPPQVAQKDWCRNDIDRFVLNKIEHAGLAPSDDALPHTLVRRLYLDLIGLLPEPLEADEWIAKIWPSANLSQVNEAAYQDLVNHLLNSPHYGERWARRWLDLARYADTNGYEKDRDRSIWPYRDWVVNALNDGMPFDQFTIEQIAGDMLPGATHSQQIATGFHRNTMLNEEGGIDPLEFRFHAMTDRVATTGTTWLGLTLGCCQCHTHKYDPITHTEYYQLMALLNNADEPMLELPEVLGAGNFQETWRQNRQRAEQLMKELPEHWPVEEATDESRSVATPATKAKAAFDEWLVRERANAAEWSNLRPLQATANLPTLTIQDDDSIFASGDTAKRDEYIVTFAPQDKPITALRLEALPDERLPARGPGSTYYEGTLGDFYLVELTANTPAAPVQFESASQSYAKNRFGKNEVSAQLTLDKDVQTGWSVDGRQGERHVAVYLLKDPIAAGQSLTINMTFGRHFASSLGRFRFSATDSSNRPQARDFDDEVERLLWRTTSLRTDAELQQLWNQFLLSAPELAEHTDKIRKLLARPEVPTSLVLAERPAEHPRRTFRHHRGEYLQPAEEVTPGVPSVLPSLPTGANANRLEFARWLVSKENPLTARVIVNRQWAAIFGTGIVATVDDFGLQGQSPSHPELLDWLALRLMNDDRWQIKELHRRIVSSRTYRQTSQVNPQARQVDPGNRLLSYAPRFRLEAEVLRDSLLVASGLIDRQLGGPPVRPLQAAGISEFAYGGPKWNASAGTQRYRRSLYTYVKRTAPFAMASTFDAPSGEACIAQRTRSNSPLQALTLLNDVMMVDFARAAGTRLAQSNSQTTDTALMTQLFRSVLLRSPQLAERELLENFFQEQLQQFLNDPQAARELVSGDSKKLPANQETDAGQLARTAAWIASARALFAIDETLTRN